MLFLILFILVPYQPRPIAVPDILEENALIPRFWAASQFSSRSSMKRIWEESISLFDDVGVELRLGFAHP